MTCLKCQDCQIQETQISFLTNVAFLKIQIEGYYVLRVSLSFKDWLFSWFDQVTLLWFLQKKSSQKWPNEICVYKSQHFGVHFGWGDTQRLPRMLGQDLTVISGFMFSGGSCSVLAFLKGMAGSESPSGNLAPMGDAKTSHDLEKMQVKCHPSLGVQSPTEHWSLFIFKMKWFPLTLHTIQVRVLK